MLIFLLIWCQRICAEGGGKHVTHVSKFWSSIRALRHAWAPVPAWGWRELITAMRRMPVPQM